MKTIAPRIALGILFAQVLILLTCIPSRAAQSAQNGVNDEAKPIQLVYVGGQVKVPARYPFTNGMTLSIAIKMAKGVTDEASPTKVRLTREGKKPLILDRQKIENGKVEDVKLQPGDTVFVPKRHEDRR